MSEQICEIVITAPSIDWLVGFTQQLVERRLVACGQHVERVRSVYRWEGKVEDDSEARVALHTRLSHVDAILEFARGEHPYKVPCIIALPVVAGHPEYIQWVIDETAS